MDSEASLIRDDEGGPIMYRLKSDDYVQSMCDFPIANVGRFTIDDRSGKMVVNQIFGIEHDFKPDYETPEILTGFQDYLDLVTAIVDDDVVSAQDSVKRIQHEVIDIKIPQNGLDTTKKDVSVTEYALFDMLNVKELVEKTGSSLALLNPSPGTITRMNKIGLILPIYIVGREYDRYEVDLELRVTQEKYPVIVRRVNKYADLPDMTYYCGMSADKAYHNGVAKFIGFSLDPYSYLVSGKNFSTSVKQAFGMYYEYLRDSYVSSLYYHSVVRCFRYGVDAVQKLLYSAKNSLCGKVWTLMSSFELPIPFPGSNDGKTSYHKVCPMIDAELLGGTPSSDVETPYGRMLITGRRGVTFVFDVISPLDRGGRDRLIDAYVQSERTKGAYIEKALHRTQDSRDELGYWMRAPHLSCGIKDTASIERVNPVKTTTEVCCYEAENLLYSGPDVIKTEIGYVLKINVNHIQPCIFKTILGKHYIGVPDRPDRYFQIEHKYKKKHSGYDFIRKCSVDIESTAYDINILELLHIIKPVSRGKMTLIGYHPEYGVVKGSPEYYLGSQGYVWARDGSVALVKGKGPVKSVKKDEQFFIATDATFKRVITLAQVSMRDPIISRETYMAMTGNSYLVAKYAKPSDLGEVVSSGVRSMDNV